MENEMKRANQRAGLVAAAVFLFCILLLSASLFAQVPNTAVHASGSVWAAALSVGHDHSCALTGTGGGKCWGHNQYGQLGDGTTNDALTPVDVIGLTSGVKAIDAGGFHTCALLNNGKVKCWGKNSYGALGNNTHAEQHTPVPVDVCTDANCASSLSGVTAGQRLYHSLPELMAQGTQAKEGIKARPRHCGEWDYGIAHHAKEKCG